MLVALAVSACATRLPPIGIDGQPFTPDADERLLWAQAEREATALLKRVRLYEDPLLDAYLARLVDRLVPDGARTAGAPVLRVSVIRDPTLDAFALPDGRVFVHTGLLAAVENEASSRWSWPGDRSRSSSASAIRLPRRWPDARPLRGRGAAEPDRRRDSPAPARRWRAWPR